MLRTNTLCRTTHSNPLSGLGPGGLGGRSYTCDETTLTYKDPARTVTYKREKK